MRKVQGLVTVFVASMLLLLGGRLSQAQRADANDEFASYQPPMLSRTDWKAKPATPGLRPHTVRSIVVHHTAVRQNSKGTLERKLANLQSFSQRPGTVGANAKPAWPDVPYHYYIDLNGRLAEGRDPRFMGDSNTKYNLDGHVQVVLEGDFEVERPGALQLKALTDTLLWLSLRWTIAPERISTHKHNASTTCPGRHLSSAMQTVIDEVRQRREKALGEACDKSSPENCQK